MYLNLCPGPNVFSLIIEAEVGVELLWIIGREGWVGGEGRYKA